MRAYRQGDVDFLCAVYAVMNACRLAMKDYHKLSFEEGCHFYQHLISHLMKKKLLKEILHQGSSNDITMEVFGAAKEYLNKKYGLVLHYKRPFMETKDTINRVLKLIRHFLGRNSNSSCVFRFYNRSVLNHWSVIKRGYGLRLKLFDSYSYPEIHINNSLWNSISHSFWLPNNKRDSRNHITKDGIVLVKVTQQRG